MADDLDRYLEDLGIDLEGDASPDPLASRTELRDPLSTPLIAAGPLRGSSKQRCESFLNNLLLHFDPNYTIEVRESSQGDLKVGIYGGDSGKMIGKGGRTLSALEYLTNVIINRDLDDKRVRVSIDAGNYKRRRDERLRLIAHKAASRVKRTGLAVELEPMEAVERRIIHLEVARQYGIVSESMGEGSNRRVVIKPA
ncbi:MAG: R3H domain-containing nucleic acid-binding protein [Deinococcales bacterium]